MSTIQHLPTRLVFAPYLYAFMLRKLALPMINHLMIVTALLLLGCADAMSEDPIINPIPADTLQQPEAKPQAAEIIVPDRVVVSNPATKPAKSAAIDSLPAPMPAGFLDFAKSLIGTPYLYASTDPAKGFDCSGFISYVFRHFGFTVPRSSVDFTHYGQTIAEEYVKPGDLILFTGTDSSIRVVGHMGIVVEHNDNQTAFIHSTSGKAYGVTITPLNTYYRGRFVKFIRVFSAQ